MISGFFGDEDGLFFEIELIASDGLELPVDAMLDTGFSYWLWGNDIRKFAGTNGLDRHSSTTATTCVL